MQVDFSPIVDEVLTGISIAAVIIVVIGVIQIVWILNKKKEKQHGKRKQSNSIRQFR